MGSRREEEQNEKIIRGLMKLPPNRKCINCNSLLAWLRSELAEAPLEYFRLLVETLSLGSIKKEDNASMSS